MLALWAFAQRSAGQLFVLVSVVLPGRLEMGLAGHAKQATALGELCLPVPVAEKTVVANALEPVGQHMEQEAPDELVSRQRHHPDVSVSTIVFPLEPDLIVLDIEQAIV